MADPNRPYIVVSADTHAGADLHGYRAYLPSAWHERFDAWAADFSDGWSVVDVEGDNRLGVSSFLSPINWESSRRVEELEQQGIAAEVIYPNTVPPFFPAGVITAPGPRTAEEYAPRWAGLQAHNRWLIDFCAQTPHQRIGLAQIMTWDLDDTIAEVRYAQEHGLKGVVLPVDHFDGLNSWFKPRFDRLWAVLEELQMPIHCHGVIPSNAASAENGDASPALGLYEGATFSKRPLAHFLLAGVFDRFPGLKLVMTENMASWIPGALASLDAFCDAARVPGSIHYMFANAAVTKLERKPSEAFATNGYVASFLAREDMAIRDQVGTEHIMWGADFPHHEGVWPYTLESLRAPFAGLPHDDVRKMLGQNAIEIYGLDGDALQKIADRVGPRPDQVDVPLTADEWPTDSVCPSFADLSLIFSTH